jgi:hypothetical protein
VQYKPAAQAVSSGPALTDRRIVFAGLGLETCDQVEPFHCKISARRVADPREQNEAQDEPTAHALPPGPALTP